MLWEENLSPRATLSEIAEEEKEEEKRDDDEEDQLRQLHEQQREKKPEKKMRKRKKKRRKKRKKRLASFTKFLMKDIDTVRTYIGLRNRQPQQLESNHDQSDDDDERDFESVLVHTGASEILASSQNDGPNDPYDVSNTSRRCKLNRCHWFLIVIIVVLVTFITIGVARRYSGAPPLHRRHCQVDSNSTAITKRPKKDVAIEWT